MGVVLAVVLVATVLMEVSVAVASIVGMESVGMIVVLLLHIQINTEILAVSAVKECYT